MIPPVVTVAPAPYYLLVNATPITGITLKAMRHKIDRGVWIEGREYRKGPDGNLYLSIKGFASWVESGV